MVWLVSGPSSSGKSEFISSTAGRSILGDDSYQKPLYFPFNAPEALPRDVGGIYHYNLLRTARVQTDDKGKQVVVMRAFAKDEKWQKLVQNDGYRMRCVVTVCSQSEIRRRVRDRLVVEKSLAAKQRPYPASFWSFVYGVVPLAEVYLKWFKELERLGFDYIMVDTSKGNYVTIPSTADALAIAAG